jgi:hypothetical protein
MRWVMEIMRLVAEGYTGSIRLHHHPNVAVLILGLVAWLSAGVLLPADQGTRAAPQSRAESARLFFVGQYSASADMALQLRGGAPDDLSTFEQRTSALHFLLKRHLTAEGVSKDKKKALRECAPCAGLLADLKADLVAGRALAHARLAKDPADTDAAFYLGKMDLTHVWLHNETLGQRTGWSEYREARRLLQEVLARDPAHIRARVAHAWIDFAIDTRVPWAFRWVLGGGDKHRALATMRETVGMPGSVEERAEARFALWEMLARDKQIVDARVVATDLAAQFPENMELVRFLKEHPAPVSPAP